MPKIGDFNARPAASTGAGLMSRWDAPVVRVRKRPAHVRCPSGSPAPLERASPPQSISGCCRSTIPSHRTMALLLPNRTRSNHSDIVAAKRSISASKRAICSMRWNWSRQTPGEECGGDARRVARGGPDGIDMCRRCATRTTGASIHRDIKPATCCWRADGRLKLSDSALPGCSAYRTSRPSAMWWGRPKHVARAGRRASRRRPERSV